MITPGERMDLIVSPEGTAGSELVVKWIAFDRGFGTAYNRPPEDLFVVKLEGTHAEPSPMPLVGRDIPALAIDGATQIDLTLTQQSITPFALGINGVAYKDSEPLMADVGETQVWTVTNTIDFAHPFHLHGFFFQVLSPERPLEWKDASTFRSTAPSVSPSATTIVPACGCSTVTSSTTPTPA